MVSQRRRVEVCPAWPSAASRSPSPPVPPPRASSRVWASRRQQGRAPGAPRHAHPGRGRSAACAYLAKSQATPGQLRVPAGNLALIAQLAQIREHTAGSALGEVRKSPGICATPRCHSPRDWRESVVTSPGTGPRWN